MEILTDMGASLIRTRMKEFGYSEEEIQLYTDCMDKRDMKPLMERKEELCRCYPNNECTVCKI